MVALFGLLPLLESATFFVAPMGSDRAAGHEKSPWRTIQHAVGELSPGDTLIVAPGEYDGPITLRQSGLPRRPISIVAQRNVRLKTYPGGPAISLSSASWVVIEGFALEQGILVDGRTVGVVIRGNALTGDGSGVGVELAQSRGAVVERNLVSGFQEGIVVGGDLNTLRSNIVRDSLRAGIVLGNLFQATDTTVRNNTLVDNGASSLSAGSLWIRHAADSLIENNILVAQPGRRLFTTEACDSDQHFRSNLFFSPNGLHGLTFVHQGRLRLGFRNLRLLTRDPNAIFADPAFADGLFTLQRKSPAIDVCGASGIPWERDFSGQARQVGAGMDAGAQEFDYPTGPRRLGNQLVHHGRSVRYRGVGMGDPLLDRVNQPLTHYRRVRDVWNANVVRLSIHPYVWRNASEFGGKDYVLETLRREIDAAIRAGLFVILDWHVTGWPNGFARPSDPGERPGLHDSSFDLACDFWDAASRAFGRNGAVAFEIWNEPTRGPDNWKPDAADWKALRPYWERLIAIIRRNSENLIIVAGSSWAYSMKGIRERPPSDPNIAVAWHVYAGKELNDELRWSTAFDEIANEFPVIVSEWGFDENGADYFRGGVDDFGSKFASNWLEGRDLHWVAWCWHHSVAPTMIREDWRTPTPFGQFVRGLLGLNPREPVPIVFPTAPSRIPPPAFPRLPDPS